MIDTIEQITTNGTFGHSVESIAGAALLLAFAYIVFRIGKAMVKTIETNQKLDQYYAKKVYGFKSGMLNKLAQTHNIEIEEIPCDEKEKSLMDKKYESIQKEVFNDINSS